MIILENIDELVDFVMLGQDGNIYKHSTLEAEKFLPTEPKRWTGGWQLQ